MGSAPAATERSADHPGIEFLAAHPTPAGTIEVTLAHPTGLQVLEGTPDEVFALARALDEMCVLAGASARASGWLSELRVGADVVRLGLSARGRVRFVVAAPD